MEFHEAADVFPLMGGDEYQALVENIKQHGLKHKIVLHESKILDGRNRYRACIDAGVTPEYVDWDGTGGTPLGYVQLENRDRRHMTKSQWASSGVEIEAKLAKEIAEEKREKDRANAIIREAEKRGEELDEETLNQALAILQKPGRHASDEAAASLNGKVGSRHIGSAKQLKREAPDLFKAVFDGDKTLAEARRELGKRFAATFTCYSGLPN